MAEQTSGQPAPREAEWLLVPDVPPGVRLQLSNVVEAQQLTPEVLQLLGQAMTELQRSAAALPQARGCGQLTSCDNLVGDCPKLQRCGAYLPTA